MHERVPSVPAAPPTWMSIALRRDVVRRALLYCVVVGTVLITINHVPALVRGDVSAFRLFQIALTYCVPYAVTTFASTQAIRAEWARRA